MNWYLAVPMTAGGELLGAISFGGEQPVFPREQVNIAREVAQGYAAAAVIAMPDQHLSTRLARMFQTQRFRV